MQKIDELKIEAGDRCLSVTKMQQFKRVQIDSSTDPYILGMLKAILEFDIPHMIEELKHLKGKLELIEGLKPADVEVEDVI